MFRRNVIYSYTNNNITLRIKFRQLLPHSPSIAQFEILDAPRKGMVGMAYYMSQTYWHQVTTKNNHPYTNIFE